MKQIIFFFLPVFLIFLCNSTSTAQVNIISNAEFEAGKTKWFLAKYNGAIATFSINSSLGLSGNNYAVVETSNTTAFRSDVKLFQDIEVVEKMQYQIYFMAKSKKERTIDIAIENDVEEYWKDSILIVPEKKHYGPFVFNSNVNDYLSYLAFHLGKYKNDISLDSVIVHETPSIEIAEKTNPENPGPIIYQALSGELTIHLSEPVTDPGEVTVTDLSGKMQADKTINPGESEISIQALNPGIYLVQLNINHTILKEKVVMK